MADFTEIEKTNAAWKHLFGIVGTNNGSGAGGKSWFEEVLAGSHIVTPNDIWSDSNLITFETNISGAKAGVGSTYEDRTDHANITLAVNGSDWDVTVPGFIPKIGYQVANQHPNPGYIKSITAVVDNGGNSYTLTLNSNSGVSAGSAVLHRRIFLTKDVTSNGLAWFTRSVYGNQFSSIIPNILQPQLFGVGYAVRMFQANGTEVSTTEGAWIINYQKGLILFANGFSPTSLSYQEPMYIECFRYTGALGLASGSLPSANLHDTLRYDGSQFVANSTVQADGSDLNILNRLTVSGSIVVPSGSTPTFSGTLGDEGEMKWDDNFLFLRTSKGWARTSLQYF